MTKYRAFYNNLLCCFLNSLYETKPPDIQPLPRFSASWYAMFKSLVKLTNFADLILSVLVNMFQSCRDGATRFMGITSTFGE